jgi:hypothetical protein
MPPAFAGLSFWGLQFPGFRASALHPGLYAAARVRGLGTDRAPQHSSRSMIGKSLGEQARGQSLNLFKLCLRCNPRFFHSGELGF